MKRFKSQLALLCGAVLLWSGCGSSLNTPSWYGKVSASDDALVGFGSAGNLNSAKARALSDIITQLNVEVNSSFSSQTQRQDSHLSYSSSHDVQLESLGIELNDVNYVKNEQKDGIFYIQARVPKTSLIRQFQKKSSTLLNTLNPASLSTCPSLSAKDKARLESSLKDLHLYGSLLQTLGSTPSQTNSLDKILSANSPTPQAKLVVESNLNHEIIYSDLEKELGYFYTFDANATQTLRAKVNVATNGNSAKVEIFFSILDCRSNVLFSTSVSHTHSASSLYEAVKFASHRASVQLYKKIQEWVER